MLTKEQIADEAILYYDSDREEGFEDFVEGFKYGAHWANEENKIEIDDLNDKVYNLKIKVGNYASENARLVKELLAAESELAKYTERDSE